MEGRTLGYKRAQRNKKDEKKFPLVAWMLWVFVLSGRGLCDGPIPRPEESYRLWCVSECDQVKINNLFYLLWVGRRGKDYETIFPFLLAIFRSLKTVIQIIALHLGAIWTGFTKSSRTFQVSLYFRIMSSLKLLRRYLFCFVKPSYAPPPRPPRNDIYFKRRCCDVLDTRRF
jgi:hypothetical protein